MDGDVKKLLREAEEAEMAKLIAGAQPTAGAPGRQTLMVSMQTPEGNKMVPVELATLMIIGETRDILKEVAASLQRLVDVAEYPAKTVEPSTGKLADVAG